jgi:hypothetical protein
MREKERVAEYSERERGGERESIAKKRNTKRKGNGDDKLVFQDYNMSTDYTVHTHERREREREKGEKSTREWGEVRLTVTRIMADLAKVLDLFCNGEAVTAG